MKKFLYISLLVVGMWSCTSSEGGETDKSPPPPTPDEVNEAPTVPSLVYPTNNLLCIDNTLDFEWSASTDSNGDTITYLIEVSTDNQFSEITHTTTGTPTIQTFTLEKGIAYYWRVKAIDTENAESDYSQTFNFYTEGEGINNYLPFAPELVKPLLNATKAQGTVELEWAASDADDDPLTFDVYFGTENPPTTLVSENQETTSYNIDAVASTAYYWKIVVKDDKEGQTIGQVWSFNVE
ncbi:hypothetical protein GGR42_000409 [Saonia flava]|uniref:Fibronectin type-III domain-containing protein n=1 Tax=Saonia flava TaxID=523696 RepID=A0A846QRY0_9FLAO|nr:hypothetical protein [Saonia flava]NJB69947.1 hypothetical protein [Saonia flava]